MKVSELLERVNGGENMKSIAEELGWSVDKVRRRFKPLGYEWDNSGKKWFYVGETEEPLDIDLKELLNSSPKSSHTTSHKKENNPNTTSPNDSHEIEVNSHKDSHIDSPEPKPFHMELTQQFTLEEVKILKEIIVAYSETAITREAPELEGRIAHLPKVSMKDKVRKTIVIDPRIANELDEFAESKQANKSDIIHLALRDFFDKYM